MARAVEPGTGAPAGAAPRSRGGAANPYLVTGAVSRRELFERLSRARRVTELSAPAGSGKTFLLRSWVAEAGLADRTGWVSAQAEQDPEQFWLSVLDALRATVPGSKRLRPLTPAPEIDVWAIIERLSEDLAPLRERLWLVLDDVQELRAGDLLRQLELFLLRAPAALRFVLATRHDLRLRLHRLRLEGEVTDIRTRDLAFNLHEAGLLFKGAGVDLPQPVLGQLLERTEGWAAGLRLAVLSLSGPGHPDPQRFAAEFSGSERTVAEYLLAEVLDREPPDVRDLLLRTSLLERVNGPLAEFMTGHGGAERVLQELEDANAFVVSLDPARSWFHYHQLFADLLRLELRRSASTEIPGLHIAAARWFAAHAYPVEAVRHFQAALDWDMAARTLFSNWHQLVLNGQQATGDALLRAFPREFVKTDPELAALAGASELRRGSLDRAGHWLDLAAVGQAAVPAERRQSFQLTVRHLRLSLFRQRGDGPGAVREAEQLYAEFDDPSATNLRLAADLRALALIDLGLAGVWSLQDEQAEHYFEEALVLARRIGRPYLEMMAQVLGAKSEYSFAAAEKRRMQAVELARHHGWADEPVMVDAYADQARACVWTGRLHEAEVWLDQAERLVHPEVEPIGAFLVRHARGLLELARGRYAEALTAFRAGEGFTRLIATPLPQALWTRSCQMEALIQLGELAQVDAALSKMGTQLGGSAQLRNILAALRLAQDEPLAAVAALAPALDGTIPRSGRYHLWLVEALLLQAIACQHLGGTCGADEALESALEHAEPDVVLPFLVHRAPGLLERRVSKGTAHPALVSRILAVLASPTAPGRHWVGEPGAAREPLSECEARILRFLPTNLSAPEIGRELYVSVNTVKTHMRRIYDKLGAHNRKEAVERARAFGLLARSSRA